MDLFIYQKYKTCFGSAEEWYGSHSKKGKLLNYENGKNERENTLTYSCVLKTTFWSRIKSIETTSIKTHLCLLYHSQTT